MSEPPPGDDFRRDFKKIWEQLNGIEWLAASILFALSLFLLSYWLRRLLSKWFGWNRGRIIDCYVIACVTITVVNWWFGPWIWLSWFCSYISTSTIIALLSVLFLRKTIGDVQSAERTLLLFILNVVQVVFMFASWYQICRNEDAL
ncbi:MAG TPA: hypothetical protein VH684_06870, partial [Xanthobacteraceae bacterium]